jgi:hypothetical protein
MNRTTIPIRKRHYARTKQIITRCVVASSIILAGMYCFLVVGSTALSSKVRQLDKESALIQSSIAELEVRYFTKASTITPQDVEHLAMRQVSENAISYLVLSDGPATIAFNR